MTPALCPKPPLAPPRRREWVFRPLWHIGRLLIAPFFALEISGVDRLPAETAFVLVPKHQRWEDIPLLSLATPAALHYIAKKELFEGPAMNWLMQSLGGIPLNRQRPLESRRYLRTTVDLLEAGEGVVVFPEGTYYPNGMGPGQVGMVRFILMRLSLPFVPVGIRYQKRGWKTRVCIRYGHPLKPPPENPSAPQFVQRLMTEIARLSGMAPLAAPAVGSDPSRASATGR